MPTLRITLTILTAGLLSAACGGMDDQQIASHTVHLDGRVYEVVAEFPSSVAREDVDRRLTELTIRRIDTRLMEKAPATIVDPIQEIVFGAVAHEPDDEEQAHFFLSVEPKNPEPEAPKEDEGGVRPLDQHEKNIRPANIRAATDPDVDPASPY